MVAIGHAWFTARKTVGIFLMMNTPENKLKAYIGAPGGLDEEDDLQYIKEDGAHFPVLEAASLIKKFGTITCSKEQWNKVTLMLTQKKVENKPSEQPTTSKPA